MGIFDLFKKLVGKNKVDEIVVEKLLFSDIESWMDIKIKENELKQNEIILLIKDKIKEQNEELNKKIKILEDFDVEGKKEKVQIKEIVNDSRKDYILAVENFLESLNNLEVKVFEEFMKRINKIFFNFNKSSYKNYERATILIGKDMSNIKEDVRVFSKDLLKIYEENKEIVEFSKIIPEIKLKYNNINFINDDLNSIVEGERFLNKKISEREEENIILNRKVEEIKESKNYLDFLDIRGRRESLKLELRESILELKSLINFKVLTNFFHIFEEQMIIVKNHREDFYTNFLKDGGKLIINLLSESKLNDNKVLEKVEQINFKLEEIKNHEQEKIKDETQELYFQIKEIVLEIDNLKIEKTKEEKRREKLKVNNEELTSELKHDFDEMGVELI